MGALLAACLCGCTNDEHKSELVGTAGVVKLKFDEESPHPSQTTPLSAKRISAQNSQRSLPEIPQTVPRQDSGDTTSELYATVGVDRGAQAVNKTTPSATRSSDHPYEHAYARLQDGAPHVDEFATTSEVVSANNPPSQEESQNNPDNGGVVITASVAISGQVSSSQDLPYMTPPVASLASSNPNNLSATGPQANQQHFSGDSTDSAKGYTSISVREPLSTIRANLQTTNRNSQPHYATVSDDSADEMYAAIDEPINQVYTSGSETYAQIQPTVTKATLHAAPSSTSSSNGPTNNRLDEPSTSGLSQVAEIAEPTPRPSTSETANKHQIPKHTRQSSNSSCNGSVGTLGSPKPEKRQANSPLPPTPAINNVDNSPNVAHSKKSHDSPVHHTKSSNKQRISSTGDLHNNNEKIRRSLNEKHQRNNSCVSSSDFYGCNYPVDKHRYSSGDLSRPLVARELNFNIDSKSNENIVDTIYNTIDGNNDIYAAIDQVSESITKVSVGNQTPNSPLKNLDEMYAKVIKKSKNINNHVDPRAHQFNRMTSSHDEIDSRVPEQNSNTTTVVTRHKKTHSENRLSWNNETKRYSGASPTNITIPSDVNLRKTPSPGRNSRLSAKEDPDYETIERNRTKNHGYETIDKNVAKHRSDLGYESVKESNKNHKRRTIPNASSEHNNFHRNSLGIEPGYETLHSGPDSILSNDPGYEHINRAERCPSDSDPNYEVLRPQGNIPPYATIQNKSLNNVGYSVINKKPKLPDTNWHGNNNEFINVEPNYESMPHETLYNTGSESDPNYESVGPKDPNYESVKYLDVSLKDPPYEKVHERKSSESSSGSHFNRTGSGASYERVKTVLKYEDKNDNRANGLPLTVNSENAPVGDYFQV